MEAQEIHERIEDAGHQRNKRVAVLIAALAAMLAISETGGKGAQLYSMNANLEAADTWAFFQAKTIRMTVNRAAADVVEAIAQDAPDPATKARVEAKVAAFRDEARRLDSDEQTREGRRELAERAKAAQARRDHEMARYHNFEYGSAALQLAIVLASASVITGVTLLAWTAGGLGLLGTALSLLGWFAPNLLERFLG